MRDPGIANGLLTLRLRPLWSCQRRVARRADARRQAAAVTLQCRAAGPAVSRWRFARAPRKRRAARGQTALAAGHRAQTARVLRAERCQGNRHCLRRDRNGEKILGREAEFAAASPQVDATIAGDLKDPGDGRRFLRIVQMRLAPDRFHHVLGHILRRDRSKPEVDHLRLHARPQMVEQDSKGLLITAGSDRDQEMVQMVRPRRRTSSPAGRLVGLHPGSRVHGTRRGEAARRDARAEKSGPPRAALGHRRSIGALPVSGCAGCHVLPADRPTRHPGPAGAVGARPRLIDSVPSSPEMG
jgi:hypothetical protein